MTVEQIRSRLEELSLQQPSLSSMQEVEFLLDSLADMDESMAEIRNGATIN